MVTKYTQKTEMMIKSGGEHSQFSSIIDKCID